MDTNQVKSILQKAVLVAAIPVISSTQAATLKPPDNIQPCRAPIQKNPQNQLVNQSLPGLGSILTAQECLVACRVLVERRYNTNTLPDLLRIEGFKANKCQTQFTNNAAPYSGGRISCDASFTLVQAPFTYNAGCYNPNIFRPRPRAVPGRMPNGLALIESETQNALGNYFAHMAAMESAAMTAFDYLAQELEFYAAPHHLIQMAHEAINEEAEHAALARLLTEAYDGANYKIEIKPFQLRSFFEIALENAVEGCVNETFAAALGYWQQEHAVLETFKQVIAHITEEESKHAALSWEIHEWAFPQLSINEQQQIRQAQLNAIERLEQTFMVEEESSLRQALGMPDRDQVQALLKQLRTELWNVHLV